MMGQALRKLSKINPIYFALIYLAAIFVSSILIYCIPIFKLVSSLEGINLESFYTAFYFSLITITTLGYGDIVPSNDATRILASGLALFGIVLTGLFLNSLAFIISTLTQLDDRRKIEEERKDLEIEKFSKISILIEQNFNDFKYAATSLITPIEKYNPIIDTTPLMKMDFKLNDLKDLFKNNPLRRFSISKSKIEVYYDTFDFLNNNLDQLLKLGYFNFNIEVVERIVEYLSNAKLIDTRQNIIQYARQSPQNREWIENMLAGASENVAITEIANLIDDYIVLREQIKLTVILIINIENLIESLRNKK
ncbi:potassium channel family protein [Acinetobacter sp. WCHA55]|uniref:potassium channel family protein n=1 Tax=Acinetobacter sp. WCHA55 TaxID=2004646 RepID=UPI0013C33D96|nr:potassium channel family protein [Acinetobacter sp. WCHA55]